MDCAAELQHVARAKELMEAVEHIEVTNRDAVPAALLGFPGDTRRRRVVPVVREERVAVHIDVSRCHFRWRGDQTIKLAKCIVPGCGVETIELFKQVGRRSH